MGSVGEDGGDSRDPLLVRPFVLQDDEPHDDAPSAATWPADPKHEVPTQVLPALTGAPRETSRPRGRRPHRPALLIGAGVVAILAVAGWTIVRPALRPAVSASLPDRALPVVTGPAITAPSASAPEQSDPAGGNGDDDAGGQRTESAEKTQPTPTATATTRPATPSAATTSAAATKTATAPAELIPPSPLVDLQGALISGNGLCLDLEGGSAGDGQDVHVDDCNGSSPQRWRLNDDRTLEVLDMCAYIVGSGAVELTRCDTRTTAQWSLNSENGQVTNAANGLCLTDPYFGARPGKQVVIARCTGMNNQRWSFS
ncbi:hypothetical protein ACTI_72810 [Actinoplanes sp. OR16]|uniref:RICIN domain-containing protein n=1 Tax=Actinoplanes sp. OR16 TaxID=946334 RepID=UPI000F712524|nr:RICIN domain-containing protein [Actinoplanes sp. OR16]BBH70596.1 hypothetical protein ACTI_72810 [Actinoplanes sp. OR16]